MVRLGPLGASPSPASPARLNFQPLVTRFRRIYWWIVRPATRGVRAIVTDMAGRILLVRHTYTEGWYLPGGGVKRHETDESALRRELDEELGITELPPPARFGEFLNTREYKRDTIVIFTVGGFAGRLMPNREIAAAEFFNPRALPPGLSPGTRRRIDEWLGLARIDGRW